jgi:MtrB/PioB family decaheme-associated outer membrane protein
VPSPAILPGSGSTLELGTVRDRYTVKFFKNLSPGLNLNVSFRNEDKEGTRHFDRGQRIEFAVEPINSTTRQLEALLSYSRDRLQLSGGMYLTSYDNANKVLFTTRTGATDPINLSLPLSNKSWETFLNGGYNFTPTTRGSFKVSYSRATQDEQSPFIALGMNPLAPRSLAGRLDTTLVEAGLTSKPMRDLSITANLRYRDFADKTPLRQIVFTGSDAPMFTTPFSYSNTVGKVEATYRLPQGYSVLGGLEYNAQDREFPSGPGAKLWVPFRSELDETTYRLQLRKAMSETVNGSLIYAHSDRDGGSYTLPLQGAGEAVTMDQIRPLNLADRKRDKWRAMVDWSPMERLNLQFSVEDSRDKYSGLLFGITRGTAQLYNVDASFQLSQDWSVNAWVSLDNTRAEEVTQRNTTTTKFNTLEEDGTSFGLGVRGKVMGKLKVGGDVEQVRSVNSYKQTFVGPTLPTAGMLPLKDITNKMLRLKLSAEYPIQKNADLRFSLIHEKWQTDDWSWTVFAAGGPIPFAYGGTAQDGTTVTASPRQRSTFASVRYIYKFE